MISALLLALVAAATALSTGGRAAATTVASARSGGCTASATEMLVRTFVRRYDRADVAAADRLWAHEPYFQWFSSGPPGARLGASAYNRATLAHYFRSRARVHERLRITELHAGFDPQRNIVNFSGKLVRNTADLAAGPPHDFKGAAACANGGPILIVWSM